MTTTLDKRDFDSAAVLRLREDLALALRAAAHHGLAEGVCNHFSVELPDGSGRFLLNPRGLLWSEVRRDDIVMVDGQGNKLAGDHAVEPTAMFIHAAIHRLCAQGLRPAHPHALRHRADADGATGASTRRCRRTRCASTAASPSMRTTTAWRSTPPKASGSPARWATPTSPSSATTASSSAASAWTTPTTTSTTSSAPAWSRCWRARPAGRWCPWTKGSPRASASRPSANGCSPSCSSRPCGARFR